MPMIPEYGYHSYCKPQIDEPKPYPPAEIEGEHPLDYAGRCIGQLYETDPELAHKTYIGTLDILSNMCDSLLKINEDTTEKINKNFEETKEKQMNWFKKKKKESIPEIVAKSDPLPDLQDVPEFDPTLLFTKDPKVQLTIAAIKLAWKERTHIFSLGKNLRHFWDNNSYEIIECAKVLIGITIAVVFFLGLTFLLSKVCGCTYHG